MRCLKSMCILTVMSANETSQQRPSWCKYETLLRSFGGTDVKQHNRAQHPQYKCSQCSNAYADESALRAHWRSAVHASTYDAICDILFENATAKLAHQRKNPDRHHLCQRCTLDFKTMDELRKHFSSHVAHSLTYCHSCQQDFPSMTDLRAVSGVSKGAVNQIAD